MGFYKDQLGREVILSESPERIVSLVPSITELLFDLGLENETVGITKFCVHPEKWFKTKTRVGGTKNVNTDVVARLQPHLIIANKEENVKEQIEQLENIAPAWTSDVSNLEEALDMIEKIGDLTGTLRKSKEIVEKIKTNFSVLASSHGEVIAVRACYLIWKDPYMTVGGDTFIHDMLQRCSFKNVFAHARRYPEISVAEIQDAGCRVVFLSSEPFPFKQKHVAELKTQLRGCNIQLVDGEMFSWYGSRLILAGDYFQKLKNQIANRE